MLQPHYNLELCIDIMYIIPNYNEVEDLGKTDINLPRRKYIYICIEAGYFHFYMFH